MVLEHRVGHWIGDESLVCVEVSSWKGATAVGLFNFGFALFVDAQLDPVVTVNYVPFETLFIVGALINFIEVGIKFLFHHLIEVKHFMITLSKALI